jgi:hypothetical protein
VFNGDYLTFVYPVGGDSIVLLVLLVHRMSLETVRQISAEHCLGGIRLFRSAAALGAIPSEER